MAVGTELISQPYNSNPIVYSYVNLIERMARAVYDRKHLPMSIGKTVFSPVGLHNESY